MAVATVPLEVETVLRPPKIKVSVLVAEVRVEVETAGGDHTLLLRSLPAPVSVAEVQVEVDTGGGDLALLLRSLPTPVSVAEV